MTYEEHKIEKIKNLCKNAEHSMRQTIDKFYEDPTKGHVSLTMMHLSMSSVLMNILLIASTPNTESFESGGFSVPEGEQIINH